MYYCICTTFDVKQLPMCPHQATPCSHGMHFPYFQLRDNTKEQVLHNRLLFAPYNCKLQTCMYIQYIRILVGTSSACTHSHTVVCTGTKGMFDQWQDIRHFLPCTSITVQQISLGKVRVVVVNCTTVSLWKPPAAFLLVFTNLAQDWLPPKHWVY